MGALVNSSKFKEEIICNSLQSDPEGILPNSFCEVTILYYQKNIISKEKYITTSSMNINEKKNSIKFNNV